MPPARPTNTVARRLASGGIWVVIGRAGSMLGQVVATALLTRLLSPNEFGQYVFFGSLVIPASLLAMGGLNRSAIRFLAESIAMNDAARLRTAMRTMTRLAALFIGAVCTAMFLLLLAFGHQIQAGGIPLSLALLLTGWAALLALQQLLGEMFRGFHDLKWSSMLLGQSGGAIFYITFVLCFGGFCLLAQPTVGLAALATVVSFGVTMPLAMHWLHRTFLHTEATLNASGNTSQPASLEWQTVTTAALSMALAQLLMFVATQGDLWLAQYLTSPDEVGLLGAVKRVTLVTAVPTFLMNMTVASTIPDLITQKRSLDLQQILRQAAGVGFIWSLLLSVPLMIFAPWALGTMFGPYYASGGQLLFISSIGVIVYAWGGSASMVLMLTGREKAAVAIQLVTALFLFAGGYVLAAWLGITGVVIAAACANAFQALASWLLVRTELGIWTHPGVDSTAATLHFVNRTIRSFLNRNHGGLPR